MKKRLDLQFFAWTNDRATPGTPTVNPVNITSQATTGADMSPTWKDFYVQSLLENSREDRVFSQFGKKTPMKGKEAEWRKWNTFDKAMTPLLEGVIPEGKTFGMTAIKAGTTQHGDYTAISDRLQLEAYDDVIFGASEEMGAAMGETYDTLTRNVLSQGNSVAYAPHDESGTMTASDSRIELDASAKLTPALVNKCGTWLKKNKAPKIDGYYVSLIHPSVAEDLRESNEWKEYHKYSDVSPIYRGEIGELHGFRFIETTEAKVNHGADLASDKRTLLINNAAGYTGAITTVAFDGGTVAVNALVGRKIAINGVVATITANTATALTFASTDFGTISDNDVIYPGEAGALGVATYECLFMGRDAFGILEPEGEGTEMIIKQKGEIGGPLEQFSTVGYKFSHGAAILYPERLLRLEVGSSYSATDEGN